MVEEAKVVLQLLNKRGFEAFYIGGKCRTDLDNLYHRNGKRPIRDVDIVTNATPDEIKKIFPQHKEQGIAFSVVVIKFAECSFEIATYRKDNYDMDKVKRSSKKAIIVMIYIKIYCIKYISNTSIQINKICFP